MDFEKDTIECFCENRGEVSEKISLFSKAKSFLSENKKKIIIFLISLIFVVALFYIAYSFLVPRYHYSSAMDAISSNDYTKAYYHLRNCSNYKDSKAILTQNFEIIYGQVKAYGYDENGNISVQEHYKNDELIYWGIYNDDGSVKKKTVYEYDEYGNKTLEIVTAEDGTESKIEKQYRYDANGKIMSLVSKGVDENYRHEFKYDERGNEIIVEYYDQFGCLTSKIESGFDENDRLILRVKYDGDGNITYKDEREYDKNGRMRSGMLFVDKSTRYERYDENGNEIFCAEYGKDGELIELRETEYCYDEGGRVISGITYDENRKITTKEEHEYNEDGEEILAVYYDITNGGMIKYEYGDGEYCYTNYDKDGNVAVRFVREYDEKQEIGCGYDKNGNLIEKSEEELNEYGDITFETKWELQSNDDGSTTEIITSIKREFEYDENGIIIFVATDYTGYFGILDTKSEMSDPQVIYTPNYTPMGIGE